MATSLYDMSVPTLLQTMSAVGSFLDRAAAHCAETGADPEDLFSLRNFHFHAVTAYDILRMRGRADRQTRLRGPAARQWPPAHGLAGTAGVSPASLIKRISMRR